jgi:excisionase family DNA binding protein
MPLISKRAKIDSDPVLLVDNRPTDSTPKIELLTISEAARLLTVSISSVRRLMEKRAIRFTKVGGCIRFFKSDLLAYLEKQRVEPIG